MFLKTFLMVSWFAVADAYDCCSTHCGYLNLIAGFFCAASNLAKHRVSNLIRKIFLESFQFWPENFQDRVPVFYGLISRWNFSFVDNFISEGDHSLGEKGCSFFEMSCPEKYEGTKLTL